MKNIKYMFVSRDEDSLLYVEPINTKDGKEKRREKRQAEFKKSKKNFKKDLVD